MLRVRKFLKFLSNYKIITIFKQIERKNRYTFKKVQLFNIIFQNCILYLNLFKQNILPAAGHMNRSRSGLDRLHNTESSAVLPVPRLSMPKEPNHPSSSAYGI